MTEGSNALVKSRIDARAAYLLDLRLGIEGNGNGLVELFFSLRNELTKA